MNATSARLNLFTIPSGQSFLSCLADVLSDGSLCSSSSIDRDPLALARMTVFLPTRRSCHALRDELIARAATPAVLLPRIRALDDIDEDEADPLHPLLPAMSCLDRKLILTHLVLRWQESVKAHMLGLTPPSFPGAPAHAARLAADLALLMDALENQDIDFNSLKDLVPEDYAAYWSGILEFLGLFIEAWPAILAERGVMSAAARRNALFDAMTARLTCQMPDDPIVVAGSTGTLPATARLLKAVALLPHGAVVLPGLDVRMDEAAWRHIKEESNAESHPQRGMARLLRFLGVDRNIVHELGPPPDVPSLMRARLAGEALRPAVSCGGSVAADRCEPWQCDAVLEGLSYVEAANVQEEALIIALMMREAVEHPECRVALVTPDRGLARCVMAELNRWNIIVDDSAGLSLAKTPYGLFARLSAELLSRQCSSLSLLSLLKNPLCRFGERRGWTDEAARLLERLILRKEGHGSGVDGLRDALNHVVDMAEGARHLLEMLLDRLERSLSLLADLSCEGEAPFSEIVRVHWALLESLMRESQDGDDDAAPAISDGKTGCRELAEFFEKLSSASDASFQIALTDYPGLLMSYMRDSCVRSVGNAHPRLFIWGLLEARMMYVDRLILGGLNEDAWPARGACDPWLNHAMRATLGLHTVERQIGLAAHDFVQAFSMPGVTLTRSLKSQGAQTVKSRWLLRLDTALRLRGVKEGLRPNGDLWRRRAQRLCDSGLREQALPPAPCPPLAARPRCLPVSQIGTWLRDPYALYARYILRLRPLDPLPPALDHARFGIAFHDILAEFMKQNPDFNDGHRAEAMLCAIGDRVFASLSNMPEIWVFWRRYFRRVARWFVSREANDQNDRVRSFCEVSGRLRWGDDENGFTLTARADRIDILTNGSLAIYDYKTGQLPTRGDVDSGLELQLYLEAEIALRDGFDMDVPYKSVHGIERLSYINVSGGQRTGNIVDVNVMPWDLNPTPLETVRNLVAEFDDPGKPYCSSVQPKFEGRFNGRYDHLARVREWSSRPVDESS